MQETLDQALQTAEDLYTPLRDAWQDLPMTAQEGLVFILLLIVVLVLRRIIARLIVTNLKRMAKYSKMEWDNLVLNTVERPLRYITYAVAIALAVVLLDADGMVGDFATSISSSLVIIAIFMLIYALASYITSQPPLMYRATGINFDEQLLPFLRTGLRVVLIALAIVIILNEWGYDVNGLIAGLGIGGLAIALAAQETLGNLFGFTTIVTDQPLVEGEYIVTPDVEGIVSKVGLRSTRIRRLDEGYVTIPNSMLAGSVITNWSRLHRRRVDFVVGVTYSTDSGQMRDLLQKIRDGLAAREKVQPETIQVFFTSFGDSALNIMVRCYVSIPDWNEWMAEQEAINLDVMDLVENMGLSMAFPSRSLYLESLPQVAEDALPPLTQDHRPHEAYDEGPSMVQADAPDEGD